VPTNQFFIAERTVGTTRSSSLPTLRLLLIDLFAHHARLLEEGVPPPDLFAEKTGGNDVGFASLYSRYDF